jgi:predicted permease
VGYVAVVKLGVATLIGIGAARLLGLHGTVLHTVAIMAAMPTAMMSLVIGARSGLRADVLAGAVVVTTLLSTLTLPAWRALLL